MFPKPFQYFWWSFLNRVDADACLVTTFFKYYRCFHDFILLSKCRQAGVGKPVTGFVRQKSGFPGLARPGNKNGRKLLQGVAERRGKKAFDIYADKSKIEF